MVDEPNVFRSDLYLHKEAPMALPAWRLLHFRPQLRVDQKVKSSVVFCPYWSSTLPVNKSVIQGVLLTKEISETVGAQ